MVYKRSEYRRQFKISTLEKNIPSYLERVNYRELRKQREYSHTPISWDGELLDSEESDEKLTPEEEVKQLPVSDLAITEEEEENEEDSEGETDSVEREKKKAQEKEKEGDDVVITKQDDELRKSAKEKLSKYTFKENKDDPSQTKAAGPSVSKTKFSVGKTFVKPQKVDEKTFVRKSKPRRPDRLNKIPKLQIRPKSAPPSRQSNQEPVRSQPFLAYGCGADERETSTKKTFNIRASSAVYPAALRAQKRNQLQVEKLKEKQRTASAKEKRKKALFNDKMARETASWDTEYRRNYPAYDNTMYKESGPDRSARKQKSVFVT